MGTRHKRGPEFYRAALLGVMDSAGELSPGLRRVAKGFSAAEGYNLRDLNEGKWTRGMKARVSRYFHALQELTAQEKVIVHTRSPARLRNAQAIGGHDPHYKFKVAFLPGSAGAQVEWGEDNTPIVRERGYRKIGIEFDQVALAVDPDAEIARVLDHPDMRRAQRFGIEAGPNVMYGGAEGIPDRKGVFAKVRRLMSQYDGRKALPARRRGSKRHDNRPESHHFSKWLIGLQGFRFDKDPSKVPPKAFGKIEVENAKLRKRRANWRKRESRK